MIEYLRSFRWVDYFFFVVTEPRKLVLLFSKEGKRSFVIGFINVAFVSLIDILALSLMGRETLYFYNKITYGWIFSFLLLVLQLVILASLVDFTCQMLGRTGNVKSLVNLLNLCLFPRAFLLPALYISVVFRFAPTFFYIFLSLVLIVWSAVIAVQGISEIYSMNVGRSVAALLMPIVMAGIMVFFLIVLAVVNIAAYLTLLVA